MYLGENDIEMGLGKFRFKRPSLKSIGRGALRIGAASMTGGASLLLERKNRRAVMRRSPKPVRKFRMKKGLGDMMDIPEAMGDYDTGLGKFSFKKAFKVTSKTFAKIKPSGIFKTALNVVLPGSAAVIGKVAEVGQKAMSAVEQKKVSQAITQAADKAEADLQAKAAAARAAIKEAPTQAARLTQQENLLNINKEIKSVEAQANAALNTVAPSGGAATPSAPAVAQAVAPTIQETAESAPPAPREKSKKDFMGFLSSISTPVKIGAGVLAVAGVGYLVFRRK